MRRRIRPLIIIATVTLVILPCSVPVSGGTDGLAIADAYPNPSSDVTTFTLTVPSVGVIAIAVYGVVGEHVRTLYDGYHEAGVYPVRCEGNDMNGVPAVQGVNICALQADQFPASITNVVDRSR